MRKRKAYLVIELTEHELTTLPPHLAAIVGRPEVRPIQTRQGPDQWFPTEEQKREQRRKAQAKKED